MGVVRRIMNELTILDFALGIALLYHWGLPAHIDPQQSTGLPQRTLLEVRSQSIL